MTRARLRNVILRLASAQPPRDRCQRDHVLADGGASFCGCESTPRHRYERGYDGAGKKKVRNGPSAFLRAVAIWFLQDGAGGDRLQAPGIALSICSRLIEVQEPRRARGEAGGGGGLGLLINMVAFKAPSQSRSGSRSPAFASSMIFWATDVVYCGGWAVGAHLRETPPSSREAARGGVRELVEKHGSRR